MADQQILVTGTSAVPLTYEVPNAIEAALLCVNATVDGSVASGSFLATVEIVSDGGIVVARCPCFTILAAGASAEISWFRLRDQTIASGTIVSQYQGLIESLGGLVLYWKLDDAAGSGTTVDSVGSNDGTVYGLVTQGEPPLADVASALYTAGMTGRKVDTPVDQTTQVMSAVIWVKTTSVNANNWIAYADTSSPNGRWFQWDMDMNGDINVTVFNTAAAAVTFGAVAGANDGVKHCIAWTYDATVPATGAGAVGSIYVDGVLSRATALAMGGSGLAFSNHSMVLGAKWINAFNDPAGTEQFPGTLDEFALFNTALSASDIADINAAGRV